MTYQDIYSLAAAYIAENESDDDTDDLRARAVSLINSTVIGMWELNNAYLVSRDSEATDLASFVPATNLTAVFPLSSRFAPAAALFCASHLISDENPSLSESLSSDYRAALSGIASEISAECGRILDVYA